MWLAARKGRVAVKANQIMSWPAAGGRVGHNGARESNPIAATPTPTLRVGILWKPAAERPTLTGRATAWRGPPDRGHSAYRQNSTFRDLDVKLFPRCYPLGWNCLWTERRYSLSTWV